MTEWWAKLQGDKRGLELLQEHLSMSNNRIIIDGSFHYLRLGCYPEDISPDILHEKTRHLLAVLNGAAKLRFGKFAEVSSHVVIKFNDDGTKIGYGNLTLLERSFALTLPPLPDRLIESWVHLGSNYELVERALTLYGSLNKNWQSLYKVLEVIEDDLGGERELENRRWVSRTRLKRFKWTANSFKAIGHQARHATTNKEPPASPMSLNDAEELIQGILKNWLAMKNANESAG